MSLNTRRLRMTPCAARVSVTAPKLAPGGNVTRSGAALLPAAGRPSPRSAAAPNLLGLTGPCPPPPPASGLSSPPDMLQHDRRRQSVDLLATAASAAALLPDGAQGPRRAHPLVPQLERQAGAPLDRRRQLAGRERRWPPPRLRRSAAGRPRPRPAGAPPPARGTGASGTACRAVGLSVFERRGEHLGFVAQRPGRSARRPSPRRAGGHEGEAW